MGEVCWLISMLTVFARQARDQKEGEENYHSNLEKLDTQIESVQDFWRYHNNTPIDQIKMRESIYLFKQGFRPVWEDRRNITGGSWTFRVPKTVGPEFWTQIQLLAIGEKLQGALDGGELGSIIPVAEFHLFPSLSRAKDGRDGLVHELKNGQPANTVSLDDQLAGVGLSVRFNSHLITIWHREGSRKASIDGLLKCVMEELPAELQPKPDTYFYKKHSEHAGFKAPPELQAVLDSQKRAEALKTQKKQQLQQEPIPE